MKTLKFRDMKAQKSFTSNKYKLGKKKLKNGRYMHFAKCKAPSGVESFRIVAADFKG